MTAQDFSVSGQRVLVVGAARSGVAAAFLLAKRGARVTLTDRKPQIPEQSRLADAGVTLELGEHRSESFETADLIVLSGCAAVEKAASHNRVVIGYLRSASEYSAHRVMSPRRVDGGYL